MHSTDYDNRIIAQSHTIQMYVKPTGSAEKWVAVAECTVAPEQKKKRYVRNGKSGAVEFEAEMQRQQRTTSTTVSLLQQ